MNRLMRFLVGCAIGALVALLLLPRVKGDWRRLLADRVRSSLRQLLGLEPEAPVPAPQTAVSAPVESVVTPEPQGVAVGATSPAAPAEETPEMASAGPTAADLRARVEETRLAVKEALERPFGTLPAETTDTERPMEETPASGAAMLAATLAEADVGEELPSSAEETLAAESADSPAVGAPETAEVECIASGVVVEAPPWVEVPTATLEEDSVVAVEETAAGQTLADDQAAQGLREEEVSAATDAELEIVDEQAAGPIAEETAADVEAEAARPGR